MNTDDTIAAVSSPPGASVRGIVRIAGPEAFALGAKLFTSKGWGAADSASSPTPARLTGVITVQGRQLTALAYLFRAPRSYTGGDIVELHTTGSSVALGMIVEAAIAFGARRAEPGEFTARAFLAGRLDLSQVHGIAGMIAARSDLQLKAAERLLHGALSKRALEAREELADLLSLVEGAMDFADEPIEFITPAALRGRLTRVMERLTATVDAGLRAERWGRLPRVILAGRPNAGKSSLLNRLTGMDRAICTPVAGTTRDVITAPLALGESECLLVDIAGIEETAAASLPDGGSTESASSPESRAQAMARAAMADADLVLLVVDAGSMDTASGAGSLLPAELSVVSTDSETPIVLVANKCDLLNSAARARFMAESKPSPSKPTKPTLLFVDFAVGDSLFVSAATGEGCEALKTRIAASLVGCEVDRRDDAIALMAEHRASLDRAIDAIGRALDLAGVPESGLDHADLVASELRIAADELGVLVGRDQTEDLLGRIFARFCVGK